jgi:molybdate transport system substrate-binding protein
MERRTFLAASLAAFTAGRAFGAEAPPLKVLSSMAVQGAFDEIDPMIRKAGVRLDNQFSATVPIAERLQKGETADLVIIGKGAVDRLVKEGKVLRAVDLMISEEGLAVADDAPTPVIRNAEDFKRVVGATPSIAITARGVSGMRIQKMLRDFGLTEVLEKRAMLVDEGFTATWLLKGKVAMAVQQLSELRKAGAKNVVRFPDELQVPTTFTVAILKGASNVNAAETAVKIMSSPEAAPAWTRSLVEPITKAK